MSHFLSVGRLITVMLVTQGLTSLAQAQGDSPPVKRIAVPTLESLPHAVLPKGLFKGWCGQKDRYLLDVDGQLEAYDAGVKYATIAVSPDWRWQCSNDGEQLVYVDTRMGYITRVDIASGDSRLVASYQPKRQNTAISFSPDLKNVAVTMPLKLTADAGKLNVITLSQSPRDQQVIDQIRWSSDASRLYVAYAYTDIEVLDVTGRKLNSGKKAPSELVDGWFDFGHRSLTLFLGRDERQDVGHSIRCYLVPWKCVPLKSRVESFSIGGRGIIGTVEPLGKAHPVADDSKTIYARYAAEIRHPTSGLLARQIFSTSNGQWNYAVSVSPTGSKAVLTWHNEQAAGCGYGPDAAKCDQGILINLSKVIE